MTILVDSGTRVIVQGITGREGSFHTKLMLDYGTKVVCFSCSLLYVGANAVGNGVGVTGAPVGGAVVVGGTIVGAAVCSHCIYCGRSPLCSSH